MVEKKLTVTTMLMALEVRLDVLAILKPGWLDGQGETPTPVALDRARATLRTLLTECPDIGAPGIFPTPAGGIQAEWDIEQWAIEILFSPNGEVEYAETNSLTLETRTDAIEIFFKNTFNKQ